LLESKVYFLSIAGRGYEEIDGMKIVSMLSLKIITKLSCKSLIRLNCGVTDLMYESGIVMLNVLILKQSEGIQGFRTMLRMTIHTFIEQRLDCYC
jgi:hypothetical protein